MVTSIVLKGQYALNVNAQNKVKLGDNIVSIEKDIPFVRYRFNAYDDTAFNYIKNTMEKMKYSTHLAEINLDANTVTTLEWFKNNVTNIARFLYIDVTDENVASASISAELVNLLVAAIPYNVDRVMLRDKSTSLDLVAAKKIIETLSKQTGIKKDNFGICSSPLSFGELCCLTAVRARELMTIYSAIADVALPTANHQCMNCCGCIRYYTVEADTEMVAVSTTKEKKPKADGDDSGESKPRAPKTVKPSLHFGEFDL